MAWGSLLAEKGQIALIKQDKMVGRKYETWEEFFDDCELMCANAMEYNEDASEVYQDALHIKVSHTMIRAWFAYLAMFFGNAAMCEMVVERRLFGRSATRGADHIPGDPRLQSRRD
jgi:hypothetical protein